MRQKTKFSPARTVPTVNIFLLLFSVSDVAPVKMWWLQQERERKRKRQSYQNRSSLRWMFQRVMCFADSCYFFLSFLFCTQKKSDNVTYCAVYCLLLSPLLSFFLETNKADRQAPIVAGGTISSSRIEKEREKILLMTVMSSISVKVCQHTDTHTRLDIVKGEHKHPECWFN